MQYRSWLSVVRKNPPASQDGDNLFAFDLGGRGMAGFEGDNDDGAHEPFPFQPARFATRARYWSAVAGSTTPSVDGLNQNAIGSTVARTLGASSIAQGATRMGFTSSILAGQPCGWRHGAGACFRNPSNPNMAGGFFFAARVNMAAATSSMRVFFGLSATTGTLGGANPSTFQNMLGFAADASDATLTFLSNGTSASAEEKTIGGSWSKTDMDTLYDFAIFSPRQRSKIGFAWRNIGSSWTSLTYEPTQAPAAGVLLSPQLWLCTSAVQASGLTLDISHIYLETDY